MVDYERLIHTALHISGGFIMDIGATQKVVTIVDTGDIVVDVAAVESEVLAATKNGAEMSSAVSEELPVAVA